MSDLLDKISELEQQLVELRAKVEKEEKENKSTNKRWRAEKTGAYWFVDSDGEPTWWYEQSRNIDDFYYDTHNYFQTEEEARRYTSVLETERQLKRFADEHNGKIDWSDNNLDKYYLGYHYDVYSISVDACWIIREPRAIYFSSKKIAEQAIDEIGIDKIKEYLTYEW